MRSIKSFILVFLGILFFASCSNKIYYTTELNAKVAESGLAIHRIQFYLSKKIVLKRVDPVTNSGLTNGEIRFENGKLVEYVTIKKNTPGVCEFVDNGFMFVSFEDGHNKLLKFKPDKNGKYFEIFINPDPGNFRTITYDTAQYVFDRGSDFARLWVRKDQDYIFKVINRVAKGKVVKNDY